LNKAVLGYHNTRSLFQTLDSLGSDRDDGKITLVEFLKKMPSFVGRGQEEPLTEIFSAIDVDQSGGICYEEFCHWFTNNFTQDCAYLPDNEREFLKGYGYCMYELTEWYIAYGDENMGEDTIDDIDGFIAANGPNTDHRIIGLGGVLRTVTTKHDALHRDHLTLNNGLNFHIMKLGPFK